MYIYIYIYIYIYVCIIRICIYTFIYVLYTFICIICAYTPNNKLSFVIYMKMVQSMGSQQTRHSSNSRYPLYKGGPDFL